MNGARLIGLILALCPMAKVLIMNELFTANMER